MLKTILTLLSILSLCCIALPGNAQIITTYAGTGVGGYNGDSIAATTAQISPTMVCIDDSENLYFCDVPSRIRKISRAGIIYTYAGLADTGYTGDNGPATAAKLKIPAYICVDKKNNVYFLDGNSYIRKINRYGIINTVARVAVTGSYCCDSMAAAAATIGTVQGLATDTACNLYIADMRSHRVLKIDTAGMITTFAGGGSGGRMTDGTVATVARLSYSSSISICCDKKGNLFLYDSFYVYKINTAGTVSRFAGDGTYGYSEDVPATAAKIVLYGRMSIDTTGNLYIADQPGRLRKIRPDGIIVRYAGDSAVRGFAGDGGHPSAAQFNYVYGVAPNNKGNRLYIVDQGNRRIRLIQYFDTVTSVSTVKTAPSSLIVKSLPDGKYTLKLHTATNQAMHLTAYNMAGQTVFQRQASTNTDIPIDMSNLPSGIYMIQVVSTGFTETRKIFVH